MFSTRKILCIWFTVFLATALGVAACNTLRDTEGVDLEGGGDAGLDVAADSGADIADDLPDDVPDTADDVPDDVPFDLPDDVPFDTPDDGDNDIGDDGDARLDTPDLSDVVEDVDAGEDVEPDVVEDVVEDTPPAFPRVGGAVADWRFDEGSGGTAANSGTLDGLDLDLSGSYRWLPGRPGIAHVGFARMITEAPATALFDALTGSGEMTVEAWVRPGRRLQGGPSRIVSFSIDSSLRNFTLGQEEDWISFRSRATMTDANGIPAVEVTGQIADDVVHLVVTQDDAGDVVVYRNGSEVGTGEVGAMLNWDIAAHVVLGNERISRRPFVGEFYRVAIYDRVLEASEVDQNYVAGTHEQGLDQRPRLAFSDTMVSTDEGNSASLPVELTPVGSDSFTVPFVLTRAGVGVPLEDRMGSLAGGLGAISIPTIDIVGQIGPRTAIAHLVSTADYTTSGPTIAVVDISNDDLSLSVTPLLWFKSDFVDYTPEEYVRRWRNVVGGRDATPGETRGPRVVDGALNGRKAMELDGGDDYFDLGDGFADWSGGFTAFVVADPVAAGTATDEHLFDFSNSPTEDKIALVRNGTTCDLSLVVIDMAGTSSSINAPGEFCRGPSLFAVVIAAGATPTATIYVDGAEVASGMVGTLSTRSRSINLLANGAGVDDNRFEGNMAEVLIYDQALSLSELSEVTAYLLGRYNL